VSDLLLRKNGYARTAQIEYENGGADAVDHKEHYLLNYGDDDLMDLIYLQRLDDIQRVERIIIYQLLGKKRNKQRDFLNTGHGLSRHEIEARDSRWNEKDDFTSD
jgi:hypothetical protein